MVEPICPSCKRNTIVGHVEHDRIEWWSCEGCNYEWPRGQWADPHETEAVGYVTDSAGGRQVTERTAPSWSVGDTSICVVDDCGLPIRLVESHSSEDCEIEGTTWFHDAEEVPDDIDPCAAYAADDDHEGVPTDARQERYYDDERIHVSADRWSEDWRDTAACRDADTNLFFPAESRGVPPEAALICARCPHTGVDGPCFQFGRANAVDGVWGGVRIYQKGRVTDRQLGHAPLGHGTEAAYKRHQREGSTPCDACRDAGRAASIRRRQEIRA